MINRTIIATCSFLSLIVAAFFFCAPPTYAAGPAIVFSNNYQLWDASPDVLQLQQFLNAQGFLVSQSGAGSPGHETTTFGLHTYHALVQFQNAHGLLATGFFGPLTRADINSGGATSNSSQNTPSTISNTATTAASTTPPFSTPLPGYAPGQIILGGGGNSGGGVGGGSTPPAVDTTAPSISLTAPSNGATVGGSSVTLTATASDNVAVAGVTFYVNGVKQGSEDTSSPYSIAWDSTATSSGSKTLFAVARDTSNNFATSTSISITVDNIGPVISSISSGSPTTTAATITWTTDENANSKVVYGSTTAYGSASSSASLVTSHSIGLSGLTASSTYHYAVVSTDAQGNTATSSDQTFTTSTTGPDTTPPTAPSNLTAVANSSSELDLSWTASTDNVGVAGYKIFRASSQVGTTTSGTTYADTGLTASTTYTYIVKAYDAANNISTSSNIATSTTGTWADGFAAAPAGTVQFATLLAGYSARAPWRVPGVDYYVGVPSGTTLKDPTLGTLPACATYNSSTHAVTVNSNNCTIDGYDFTKAGGIQVSIPSAAGTIIEDSLFGASANAFGDQSLIDNRGVNTSILDNTFENDTQSNVPYFDASASGTVTIEYNYFFNIGGDAIDFDSSETVVVKYNACVQIGMTSGSHPDCVQFVAGTLGAGSNESFNLLYQPTAVTVNGNEGIQIAAQGGGVNAGYSADHNSVIAASSTVPTMSYSIMNNSASVTIASNYVDATGAFGGYIYPDGASGDVCYGNIAMATANGVSAGAFITGTFSGTDGSMTCTATGGEPMISSVSGTPGGTTATVTWTTDENSTSKVVYGTTTAYGSATSSASLVTSHSIGVTGLNPSTLYHYAVVSTDGSSNTATSSDATFTTSAEPVISAISSGNPAASTSTITWTTDENSTSKVVYGTTTAYGLATSSASLVTSHSIAVTGLTSSTLYHYEVVSVDGSGNTATSSDQTFTTAASGGGCSQATAFLARTSGLDGAHTTDYTNLICGLVTDGIWSSLDALWVPATKDSTTATLNLVSASYTLTVNGADSFTADIGYTTASGAGNYIATGYNTSTGSSFTQNSAALYLWNQKTNAGACEMGDGGNVDLLLQTFGPSGLINDTSGLNPASNLGNGWNSIDRSGASARDFYFDGTSVLNDTRGSVALSSNSLILGGVGGTTGGSSCVIAAAGVGGSLDAAHQTSFYSRMSTYMSAVGAN